MNHHSPRWKNNNALRGGGAGRIEENRVWTGANWAQLQFTYCGNEFLQIWSRVVDSGCGGVSRWIQGVEVCRGGCRVWRRVMVGAGCGGMSWWVQGVEACRGGCRVWRHVVVGAGCGGVSCVQWAHVCGFSTVW